VISKEPAPELAEVLTSVTKDIIALDDSSM
jgi:hypothetical protein